MRGSKRLAAALLVIALVMVSAPQAIAGAPAAPRQRTASGMLMGSSGIATLASDEQIPGVPLDTYPVGSHTVTGTLDAYPTSEPPVDKWDVYSVYLAPGDQISLALTGTGVNFDLVLLSPASLTVQAGEFVYTSDGPTSTERICYTASDRFGPGRYYVVVTTDASEGEYSLDWQVSGRSDGNVPGSDLGARSVTGTVDPLTDADDVYRLWLPVGQSVTCTLTADDPADEFTLWVFPPRWDNGGILEDTLDIYHAAEGLQIKGSQVSLSFVVGADRGGWHYIDVNTDGASGSYTLEWSVGVDIPGEPYRAGDTTGTLPAVSVRSVPLRWGQTLHASLWVTPTATPTEMRFWKPGTFSITGDASDVATEGTTGIVHDIATQDREGTYFLEIDTVGSPLFELRMHVLTRSCRLAGENRYATAVAVSGSTFAKGANTVVIASGEGFADAVAASSLAGAYDAPLLLVGAKSLPPEVSAEIVRLGATQAFVVGGETAVSAAVSAAVDALPGMDTPVRVAGANRYETSAEVARRVLSRVGTDWDGGVFIARGDAFPDALAVGPLAWRSRRPVVLTSPSALPEASLAVLGESAPSLAVIVGGKGAVSDAVAAEIDEVAGTIERIDGATRFATAANVATYGVTHGIVGADFVGVATGTSFPDALAGGVACGAEGGVLLLTWPGALSPEAVAFIDTYAPVQQMTGCRVFGGERAVSGDVMSALDDALSYTWVTDPPAWFLAPLTP